jgi:hypothetical protein
MLTTPKKNWFIVVVVMLANVACMSPQQRWKGDMDYYVSHQYHLEYHMRTYGGTAVIKDTKELRPGVLEYYIEDGRGILKPGEECKIVFVVEKATDVIIGWRYYGEPRYCVLT